MKVRKLPYGRISEKSYGKSEQIDHRYAGDCEDSVNIRGGQKVKIVIQVFFCT